MHISSLSCLPLQNVSALTFTSWRRESNRGANSSSHPTSALYFHLSIGIMDCSGSGNIKKRIKIQLDENHERKDHNKCQDEGEKRPCGDPFLMPLLLLPKLEEWCLDASIVLTGTACGGVTGPPLGAFDIGVSKTAYYFCIALPGVNKAAGEFSCEICRVGKVCIRGVASTGGSTVSKYPRVFVMKVQQQCPPGPFKLFFTLPGPVDPRLFTGCFRPDGVFEGIVAKYEQ